MGKAKLKSIFRTGKKKQGMKSDNDKNFFGIYDYSSVAFMEFKGGSNKHTLTAKVNAEAEDGKSTALSFPLFAGSSELEINLSCDDEKVKEKCKHFVVIKGSTSLNMAGSSMENTTVKLTCNSIVNFDGKANTTESVELDNEREQTGTITVTRNTKNTITTGGNLDGNGVADGKPITFKSNLSIVHDDKVDFTAKLPVERFNAVRIAKMFSHLYSKVIPIECNETKVIPIESKFNFAQTFGIPTQQKEAVLLEEIDTEIRTFGWEFILENKILSVELKSFCGEEELKKVPDFLKEFEKKEDPKKEEEKKEETPKKEEEKKEEEKKSEKPEEKKEESKTSSSTSRTTKKVETNAKGKED
ncbi:MAG: hypothetical protein EP338_02095 [Bacteroidetes bacterium]|nr:MAG: hypothetical protein EP338_02095 [Bacteroidota bacterium]